MFHKFISSICTIQKKAKPHVLYTSSLHFPLICLLITFSAEVTPVKMPQGHPGGIVAGVKGLKSVSLQWVTDTRKHYQVTV
jgi:hypothetical protein